MNSRGTRATRPGSSTTHGRPTPPPRRQLRAVVRARAAVIRSFSAAAPRQTLSDVAAAAGSRAPAPAAFCSRCRRWATCHRRQALHADAAHPRPGVRLPVVHADLEPRRAGDGSAGGAGEGVVLGRGAGGHRHRLRAARAHPQDHAQQPGRGLAPAGLLHVDGPHAAGRPAGRRCAMARLQAASIEAHAAHADRPDACWPRCSRRASRAGAW
jgi:hypothetical protein